MGIIRLTLLTLVLIWLAMMYFGRDDGLPERVIGREPSAPAATPDPVRAPDPPAEALPEPEPEPPVAAAPAESDTPEPSDAMEDAIGAAIEEATPVPEPEPEPTPEPEPAPAPAPDSVLYVTGATVNVRSGPSTVYNAITALPRGAAVVDLGDAGEGWRMIRLETGETGYMSGDFLSPVAP